MQHQIDTQVVREFFDDVIRVEGYCAEVRIPRAKIDFRSRLITPSDPTYKGASIVGWFTRSDELACELLRVRGVTNFITMNPVKIQGRPGEARNRFIQGKKGYFADAADIAFLRYAMIDVDPVKTVPPRRQNATDAERDACREMIAEILHDYGLAEHAVSGHGNGAFALVRLPDWPNDTVHRNKVQHLIQSLASKYSTVRCFVDPDTHKPTQGVGIPGTWKFKGTEEPGRPYRKVTLEAETDAQANTDRPGALVQATA